MPKQLALIGCGKMGSALLKGWINTNLSYDISVFQPDPLPNDLPLKSFSYFSAPEIAKNFDIVVFAVKPQVMDQILAEYKSIISSDTLLISIAAGISVEKFEGAYGTNQPIIRAMPNTPAAIGHGITVAVANENVSSAQKEDANILLRATGHSEWIENETLMDTVTAVSGSGPAYLFYLIEALTKSAEDQGLPKDLASKLARQTIIGAAALADHDRETDITELRKNVTSPGGTTEAALYVLMSGEWQDILSKAVQAATQRSKELSS